MVRIVGRLVSIYMCIVVLMLTGCHRITGESAIQSSAFISQESTTMQTDIPESDTVNGENNLEQSKSESVFDINVDVSAASDKFSLTTVTIPSEHNGQWLEMLYLLDKSTLLCGLSKDDDIHEIGIWKLDVSEYTKLLDVDPGQWYVVAAESDYIFLEYLSGFDDTGMSKTAQLWKYRWKTEEFEVIFNYSQNVDGYNGGVYANHRLLYDGYLYFEDLVQNEANRWVGKAYRYNIENGQIEFLGDNLQNPLLMNDAVWYIQINSFLSHHQIKNITSGEIIQLPEHILEIVSTGKDILVCYAAGENEENGLTIFALKQVDTEDDIFTAEAYMELFQANEYFTVWTSYRDEYPVLYDNIHKQILYLDCMDKAEHHYLLKDNYGIIETLIYNDDGTTEKKYTFFESNQ